MTLFTYTKEKELHEYIVEHFDRYFDFDYISSEFIIESGRVDIIGQSDNIIYVIEIKRDIITDSTIEQLTGYVIDMQRRKPHKRVEGIAIAPTIDKDINLSLISDNITLKTIDDVRYVPSQSNSTRKRITFTLDEEKLDQLKLVSNLTDIPQSRLVEQAIKDVLKKYGN